MGTKTFNLVVRLGAAYAVKSTMPGVVMTRHFAKTKLLQANQGFSLVEILMALVMMGLLMGTNRVVTQGMAASGRAGLRSGIEQEILNDIESIQAIDTMLNAEPALSIACDQGRSNSSDYLAQKIAEELAVPTTSNWDRDLNSDNKLLLVVTYEFEIPGRTSNNEKRVIELSPSFAPSCPLAL